MKTSFGKSKEFSAASVSIFRILLPLGGRKSAWTQLTYWNTEDQRTEHEKPKSSHLPCHEMAKQHEQLLINYPIICGNHSSSFWNLSSGTKTYCKYSLSANWGQSDFIRSQYSVWHKTDLSVKILKAEFHATRLYCPNNQKNWSGIYSWNHFYCFLLL